MKNRQLVGRTYLVVGQSILVELMVAVKRAQLSSSVVCNLRDLIGNHVCVFCRPFTDLAFTFV